MDLIGNLGLGFGVAFTLQNLAYAFGGAVLGTLIGVLPGLGPVATIAMLLPSIYSLETIPALIMLAGIYYGAQYGGSTTAILINVPGESSSVVTALDGYQMARRGRVGAALAVAALGSFFAGCVGTVVIVAFAPPLTALAFEFGPARFASADSRMPRLPVRFPTEQAGTAAPAQAAHRSARGSTPRSPARASRGVSAARSTTSASGTSTPAVDTRRPKARV